MAMLVSSGLFLTEVFFACTTRELSKFDTKEVWHLQFSGLKTWRFAGLKLSYWQLAGLFLSASMLDDVLRLRGLHTCSVNTHNELAV